MPNYHSWHLCDFGIQISLIFSFIWTKFGASIPWNGTPAKLPRNPDDISSFQLSSLEIHYSEYRNGSLNTESWNIRATIFEFLWLRIVSRFSVFRFLVSDFINILKSDGICRADSKYWSYYILNIYESKLNYFKKICML